MAWFQFWGKQHLLHIDVLSPRNILNVQHRIEWVQLDRQKKKNITMTPRHRILCAKLPDGHLKFECSVLCSNVDFYFKFNEYSKKKKKKKIDSPKADPPPLQPLQQCWQHSYIYFPNTTSGYDAEHVHSTSLVDHGDACSEWNLSC